MKTINFLGNPASPHIRHWEMVLAANEFSAVVYGIPHHTRTQLLVKFVTTLGPAIAKIFPVQIAYVLAGFWLRTRSLEGKPVANFFHAHNTSGYGLTAWLSGVPYGVTTYGSEIFDASSKSNLYRFIIRRVLHGAKFITSSSPRMTEVLVSEFSVSSEYIRELYLGVSPVFRYSQQARRHGRSRLGISDNEKVWIANRRMHEIYRTLEMVRAFNMFSANSPCGHLILMEGDADIKYAETVRLATGANSRIHIVPGFIGQDELSDLLCIADYAISIPKSDQLSSSILEAMQCNAIPILAKLESYQAVGLAAEWVDVDQMDLHENLLLMFSRTANYRIDEMDNARRIVQGKIEELNNKDNIAKVIHDLYEQ